MSSRKSAHKIARKARRSTGKFSVVSLEKTQRPILSKFDAEAAIPSTLETPAVKPRVKMAKTAPPNLESILSPEMVYNLEVGEQFQRLAEIQKEQRIKAFSVIQHTQEKAITELGKNTSIEFDKLSLTPLNLEPDRGPTRLFSEEEEPMSE